MITFRILLWLLVAHQTASVMHAKHWNVFLAIGQSNMVGSTHYSAVHSDGSYDSSIAFIMKAGTHGAETITDGWVTFADVSTKQGPERGFARTLADEGLPNVAIVKYAINGSSLCDDFRKDAVGGKGLYPDMLEFIQSALSALRQNGDIYTLHGIIWLQGTADTQSQQKASLYGNYLEEFIRDIRDDLDMAGLKFTVARHPAFWSNRDPASVVRQAQVDVSNEDPLTSIIDCEGTDHVGDYVHYDVESKEILGVRFAQNFLNNGRSFFGYMMKHGGAQLSILPSEDDDGDGRVNLEEYFVGTDPLFPSDRSLLRVAPYSDRAFQAKHAAFLNDLNVHAEILDSANLEWVSIGKPEETYSSGDGTATSIWSLPLNHDESAVIVRFNLSLIGQ